MRFRCVIEQDLKKQVQMNDKLNYKTELTQKKKNKVDFVLQVRWLNYDKWEKV